MARFRATIHGNRGKASRLGTPNSGMMATVNGWDIGVEVALYVNQKGEDAVQIYRTGGSNGGRSSTLIAEFKNEG